MEIQLDRSIFPTHHTAAVGLTPPPHSLPPPHNRWGRLSTSPAFVLQKTVYRNQFCRKAVIWFRQSGRQDIMCYCAFGRRRRCKHRPLTVNMAPRPASTIHKDVFRRRHKTIGKKANDLAQACGAQVYCVVLFHGRYYIYSSHKNGGWPPTKDQIVRIKDWFVSIWY